MIKVAKITIKLLEFYRQEWPCKGHMLAPSRGTHKGLRVDRGAIHLARPSDINNTFPQPDYSRLEVGQKKNTLITT